MKLHRTSSQHPEIGSFATRLLWIPAVASILFAGYLMLRTPHDDGAAAMALTTAHAVAPVVPATPPLDIAPQLPQAAPSPSDEATAAHKALDPVGAGHDFAN